jgi:serine/threonine-protein kinase HipA
MTISDSPYNEAFVWIWLPETTKPVVAGKLTADKGGFLTFNYGKSYLERTNAISIYTPELPLQSGELPLLSGLNMPGCIRDASPDAWGRRVLINNKLGVKGNNSNNIQLDELTYLLESGSDRIGALDFQLSPTEYIPRTSVNVKLEELIKSAERVEKGIPLSPELDQALHHGTSIGGARPKALIESTSFDKKKKYIAKFSSDSDLYSIVKAEFIAMRLARLAGLDVASVSLTRSSHKDVLLVERFDRITSSNGWQRKNIISALTLFKLDEMMARYASYEKLAEIIRHHFTQASKTLMELFSRLVFNILTGNTDDHARNHAAFWDGSRLTLTPAYDICPQGRTGSEASQAMLISDTNNLSQIKNCLDATHHFLLSRDEGIAIYENQVEIIQANWNTVCDEAQLNEIDKKLLWRRQFLPPYATQGLDLY